MSDDAGYEIIHENTFDHTMANELSITIAQADEALGAIMYALNRNPSGFPLVYGRDVHLAKLVARPRDRLPALRVFFRLVEERKRVDLLYVDHG